MAKGARVEVEIVANNAGAKKGIAEVNDSLKGLNNKNREGNRELTRGADTAKSAFGGIAKTLGISPSLLGAASIGGAAVFAAKKSFDWVSSGSLGQAQKSVQGAYMDQIKNNLYRNTPIGWIDKNYTAALKAIAGATKPGSRSPVRDYYGQLNLAAAAVSDWALSHMREVKSPNQILAEQRAAGTLGTSALRGDALTHARGAPQPRAPVTIQVNGMTDQSAAAYVAALIQRTWPQGAGYI